MRSAIVLTFVLMGAAHAAPMERNDTILIQGNKAGTQTVRILQDGSVRAEYSYNDRDHGDHITAAWTLDDAGIPIAYEGHGNDYMKAPVEERFAFKNGKASWKNRSESGELATRGPAFYVPADAPPEFSGVLARALLKAPQRRLALLPSGEAGIEPSGSVVVEAATGEVELLLYRISGLGFMPSAVWLDREGNTAAIVSPWFSIVPSGREVSVSTLLAKQDEAYDAWSARLAAELAHAPQGDLVIRHARLFDPRDSSVTADTSVLVRGERIIRVAPDAELKPMPDSQTIDAQNRFLMPGLWDNHQHFDGADGLLDIANGVTSARDLANDTDTFLERVARFDAGTEIGPRVLKAGIIDGTGEFAGPTKMRVDTAEQAIRDVDWYADHGYAQIKMYMSLKPELVPIIADRAHARGLRVSGHVPAFMSARQFIEAGADEIQHFNYIVLNFLYPEVKETTRKSERFIKVAERAHEFSPDKPQVREFIEFLKRRHTVLDPTMGLLETRFASEPTKVTPGLEDTAPRFAPQVRRAMRSSAYAVPKGQEAAYREAFPAMLRLLRALHDAGVTIVPGTDGLAGYMLHHELELYVRAGIAPAEVLRMATLTSAEVMGVARERGAIVPGSYADMILVDGDPTRDISDIRKIATVIKGGKIYYPAQLEKALGIAPRTP
jgi:imidazolonepropionase-like amidohydrolase